MSENDGTGLKQEWLKKGRDWSLLRMLKKKDGTGLKREQKVKHEWFKNNGACLKHERIKKDGTGL
jgi:hypothetical protein